MKKLEGVITAMTTPFNKDNKVDLEAVKQQVEFLIEKGVNCLYPTGTTGEMYLMSVEERKTLAETIVKAANNRVIVYIHVGAMTKEDTIELAQHAEKIGADGVGVVTPSYFHVHDAAMIEYFTDVCNAVSENFPVYSYGIPQLAHNDLSIDVLNTLCQRCKNMIGIKYSFPDFRKMMKYKTVNNGNFSVVFGADDMFLPALCVGADGTVSGCSGPMPELFVDIYKKFKAGDIEGAKKAQYYANEVIDILEGGANMSIFKNVLKFRGINAGQMRAPLTDLVDEEVKILKEKISRFI